MAWLLARTKVVGSRKKGKKISVVKEMEERKTVGTASGAAPASHLAMPAIPGMLVCIIPPPTAHPTLIVTSIGHLCVCWWLVGGGSHGGGSVAALKRVCDINVTASYN